MTKPRRPGARPDQPDLAILLAASYTALVERLAAAMLRAGLGVVRPTQGFVIRAVAAESPTIKRLAELLATSKQAASQLADAMVRDGFLERFADPADRRLIRLRLAPRGRRVRDLALRTSATLERELVAACGPRAVASLRASLLALLERAGALDDVLHRRARPVW